jgi:hypothetical protein
VKATNFTATKQNRNAFYHKLVLDGKQGEMLNKGALNKKR